MAKKNANKKVSAIDAIKQPFQFESKSTQTHSDPHDVRLGGTSKTVSVRKKRRDEDGNVEFYWESVTRVEGGQVISASHRIRSGKTKRERAGKVKEVQVAAAPAAKGKKK